MIVKSNWKYKRIINIALSKLKWFPFLLRLTVWLIWLLRFVLRKFKKPQADYVGGVMVNDNLKLIYIGNPKVASSTMKSVFMGVLEGSQFVSNTSYSQFTKKHADKQDYCKFSFVRDPVERIYSCWRDKITNKKRFADVFIISRFKGLYPDMPFDDFVEWLCSAEGQDDFADRHWMSQSQLLISGDPAFDNINFSAMQELNDNVSSYLQRHQLRVPENLTINSMGGLSQTNVSETISKQTLQRIYERYKKDYEYFGAIFKRD